MSDLLVAIKKELYVQMMCALYVIASAIIGASSIHALENNYPSYEHVRETGRNHKAEISVSVWPQYIEFPPMTTVTIRCKANGGISVNSYPYISFYRQLGAHTVMPVTSLYPGVSIKPGIPSGPFTGRSKDVKEITLGMEAWDTLEWGDNEFYCKGSNRVGETRKASFVISKEWEPYWKARR